MMRAAALLLAAFGLCCMHTPLMVRRPAHVAALSATVHIHPSSGYGSGIAWSKDTVITAKHVMDWPPQAPEITTRSGEACIPLLATFDLNRDIAIIKVEGCKLHPIPHGKPVKQGDEIWAAGHPMSQSWSVSRGIVMAIRDDHVQIDASVNPGMSGGPMVDKEGNLVGMIVALTTRDGLFAGIGWAIPIDQLAAAATKSL